MKTRSTELERLGSDGRQALAGAAPDRRKLGAEIRHYFALLRRRWWLIAMGALLAVAGACWQQRGHIPQYTAQVLVQQRAETPVVGLGGIGRDDDIGSQIEIIRSRAVIAPVVDSLGLQLRLRSRRSDWSRVVGSLAVVRDPPGGRFSVVRQDGQVVLSRDRGGEEVVLSRSDPGAPITGPGFTLFLADEEAVEQRISFSFQNWDAAVERLQRQIRAEPGRGAGLIRISFTDADPNLAAAVVNGVASSYQRHRAESAREAARRRGDVISSQLVQLADSLRSVQDMVLDYQRRAQLLNPGAEGNAITSARLQTENEIRQLRYEEGLLETLVAGLRSAQSGESLQRIMTMAAELVPSGRALFDRLQQLETERSRLTASRFGYTEAEPQVQVVDSLMASVRSQMQVATEQSLELLRTRLSSAEERLGQLRREAGALPERTAELARHQQRVDAVQDVFDMLVEGYYEAQIAEGVEVGDVAVIDPATAPLRPNPRNERLHMMVALMMGLFVGAVAAVVVEHLDTRVRESEDAEEVTGLEVVGKVPLLASRGAGRLESRLVGKEALRAIRTQLHFATARPHRILAVTSAEPGEGKSTIAANLALTFAEQGLRTVLVDADQRRPVVHLLGKVKRSPGLHEYLGGAADLDTVLRTSRISRNVDVLPAGGSTRGSQDGIGSVGFENLIEQLRERYDAIVVDTPPVLAVSDALVVGRVVDATLLVVRAGVSQEGALRQTIAQLRRVEAPLVGIIMNAVSMKDVSYSYYYEYYKESPPELSTAGEKRRALIGRPRQSSQTDPKKEASISS